MKVDEYTILLIRSVIHKETPPEKPIEISFEDILTFAQKHKIENICFAAIKQLNNKPDADTFRKWDYRCALNQAQEIVQENEKSCLAKAFSQNEIAFLPLKGWYMRDIYPKEEYRFMSDLDILIKETDVFRAQTLMYQLGYTGGREANSTDHSYEKKPYLHVELHSDIVQDGWVVWFDYYKGIWERAISEQRYEYRLNWNDFYVYMAVNFSKDYKSKGTGIRSVLDFYLFKNEYEKDLDFQYIDNQLKKLKIKEIEEEAVRLANEWFGTGETFHDICNDNMKEKIVKAGIYGSYRNTIQNLYNRTEINISNRHLKKIVYVFYRMFPMYKHMCRRYPVLDKVPFLLPLCWGARLLGNIKKIIIELEVIKSLK